MGASVSSTTLRARPHSQKAAIVAAVRRDVWPLLESGSIVPVIDTVVPARGAAQAHQLLADGGATGKVLLSFDA
jgi:NADPH:quinone reductase-like Zn-dependent oxidoreductase